jgi:hypothetical protein
MLKLKNLVELALFDDTVKDIISYEYEADAEGGYDIKVADGQIKECVNILAELMDELNNDDVPPWENKLYLLAMRLYDEAYYEMCYGDKI